MTTPRAAEAAEPWRARPYAPLRKVETALRGLKHAVSSDFSVAYKLVLSIGVLALSLWLRQWVDVATIAVSTVMVLAAELFNTAIEDICDYVQPETDPRIGAIKDVAAAAAGIAIAMWFAVLVWQYARLVRMLLSPAA